MHVWPSAIKSLILKDLTALDSVFPMSTLTFFSIQAQFLAPLSIFYSIVIVSMNNHDRHLPDTYHKLLTLVVRKNSALKH